MRPSSKAARAPLRDQEPASANDQPVPANPLVFTTDHPRKPALVDLREFETGAAASSSQWGGDFRGRPELIHELVPHIRAIYGTRPESTVATLRQSLRAWWRLLDEIDDLAPVTTVSDLGYIHEAEQVRRGIHATFTNNFLQSVNSRRTELGLSRLIWIKTQSSNKLATLPEQWQVKLIYEELKRRAWRALSRLDEADTVPGIDCSERVLSGKKGDAWTKPDLVATYRALSQQMAHPCPSGAQLHEQLGASREFRERCSVAIDQIYFVLDDLRAFFFLFLLLTGWNSETALDIDLDAEPVIPHPTAAGLEIVRSIKQRSNSEQVAICQSKRELAPSNLLRQLISRTEPLRAYLRRKLAALDKSAGQLERARLERAIRSPWLYPIRDGKVGRLTLVDAVRAPGRKHYLKELIRDINKRTPANRQIHETMKVGDLRDAFISFAYRQSGYNWLIAKLAAGHKDVRSTRTYLNNTHWARFGKSSVRKLTSAMWSEIGSRRLVEPAFLFALVERGEISETQRARWLVHKDRTRVGTGCKDFRHPPKLVAPGHKEGDGCRAFRCTLCPHAVVFKDSVDLLARRKAELIWGKERIPLVSWEQSIFPEELESLEQTLTLFSPDVVHGRFTHWQKQIEVGLHIPSLQEGEHE